MTPSLQDEQINESSSQTLIVPSLGVYFIILQDFPFLTEMHLTTKRDTEMSLFVMLCLLYINLNYLLKSQRRNDF